jgi:DNA-binding NtrC family response regulator
VRQRAVKEGAEHFLTKPVELPALVVILNRLLEAQRSQKRQIAGGRRDARARVDPFALPSAAMKALADDAERVARSDSPVLVVGETASARACWRGGCTSGDHAPTRPSWT